MTGAIRAEWTKFRTVSSSAWLALAVVALTVGIGLAIAGVVDVDGCASPTSCDEDTVKLSLAGVWAGQTAVAILAVLMATGEYSNRMIDVTLTATPRRLRVYAAKAVIVVLATLVVAALSVTASFVAGRAVITSNGFTAQNGYAELSLSDGPTLRAVVGSVLYLALISILSLGIGAVIRDTGVSVTVVLSLLFVLPIVAGFVSDPQWYERLQRFSPTTAGLAIQSTLGIDDLPIAPWQGLGVLGLYAIAATAAGCAAIVVRDA
jgi:ABC-2 type transport system permease protein